MAHAYTPGLRVARDAVLRRTRRLPMRGEVLAQVGDTVQRQQVVARTELPGNVRTMNVINRLGISADELPTFMLKGEGDVVRKGDLLAQVGGLFGEDPEALVSPLDGVIIGHATLPIVNQGDALFHIAEVEALDHAGEHADSIVEALAVSDPPFPAAPLLDEDEVLGRDVARRELGLDPDRPAVLVQLGSGNNFDYDEIRAVLLDHLVGDTDFQVAVAEWLISDAPAPLPDGVKRLNLQPIARYHKAFEFVVSTAGYNGFHELVLGGVPAIYVPNENPTMDEQLTRAQYAERKGLGLCLRTHEIYKVRPHVERMLDPAFRADVTARCRALSRANGAQEVATFIEQLVRTVCADREPRQYWAAP